MVLGDVLRGVMASLVMLSCAAAESLEVLVPPDVLADYRTWVSARDPLTLRDFSGPGGRRDVVELALVQQALVAGGETRSVTFSEVPTYQRSLVELRAGHALLLGTSAWRTDLEALGEDVLISRPLVAEGGFEAGLYTIPGNARALAAKSVADVRQLSVVSNPDWTADWTTLQRLAPARLDGTPTWEAMVRMVGAGNVDVLLAPFQATADLSFTVDGVRLVPIPGLKIALVGSRHLAVSAKHPHGAAVAAALDRGLLQLTADGTIERAYRDAGFINTRVATWTRIP